jgi:hypothetical protein
MLSTASSWQRPLHRGRGGGQALQLFGAAAAAAAALAAGAAQASNPEGDPAAAAAADARGALPTDKLCCKRGAAPPRTPTVLVYAGSFNPPTWAHVAVAEAAAAELAKVR